MKIAPCLLIVAILVAGAVPGRAQDGETARRADVEHLIEYGFAPADIIAWLGEKDRRIEIDAADVAILEKNGTDVLILDWLRARLPESSARKLDVAGVIALWRADRNEARLRAAVVAADRDWLLEPAEVLALAHAEVPKAVIDLMRGRGPEAKKKKKEVGETLTLDDVIRMTADGLQAAEIVTRIGASPSRYDIDAQRILELKRDGVAIEVLQALYEKRIEPEVEVPESPERPVAATLAPVEAEIAFEILREQGIGFAMLKPGSWVATKEYVSTKSLVQIVDPEGANGKGLPDLEMSVMNVHPKRRGDGETGAAQLETIAASFVETLKGQFARDGIEIAAERPRRTWIAAQPALQIETQARVAATNASYRGVFYILHAQDRIWVLSCSCRLEKSPRWLPILESCLRSFSLGDDAPVELAAATAARTEQVTALFEAWRRSVRRFDFDTYRKLHDGIEDDVASRRAFLALAASVNDEGKRLEIDGLDLDRSLIHYNVFGLDGQSRSSLTFRRVGESFRLVLDRP